MPVRNVTKDDCGRLEGEDITSLYSAFKQVCPGIEGEGLWEKIREKYKLGVAADCDAWVVRMNNAISIWNAQNPRNCAAVKTAFGV